MVASVYIFTQPTCGGLNKSTKPGQTDPTFLLPAYQAALEPLWMVEKKFGISHLSAVMALY